MCFRKIYSYFVGKDCFQYDKWYYSYSYKEKRAGETDTTWSFSEVCAMSRMGKFPTKEQIKRYARLAQTHSQAVSLLCEIRGEEVWPYLLEIAKNSKDSWVQKETVLGLWKYEHNVEILNTLLELLHKSQDISLKIVVVNSLGYIGESKAIIEMKNELDWCYKWGKIGEKEENWDKEENRDIVSYTINILFSLLKLNEKWALSEILKFFKHPNKKVISSILNGLLLLESIEDIILDSVYPLLKEKDSKVRYLAAQLILKNKWARAESDAIEIFLKDLYDFKSHFNRGSAIYVLSKYGNKKTKAIIQQHLQTETDPTNRLYVVKYNNSLPHDVVLSLLQELLSHRWPTIRFESALLLGRLSSEEAKRLAKNAIRREPDSLVKSALEYWI